MKATRTRWGFLGAALLGAMAGGFGVPRLARACECPDTTWLVALQSVTAKDPDKADDTLWADGDVTLSDSYVMMELGYPGEDVAMIRLRGTR